VEHRRNELLNQAVREASEWARRYPDVKGSMSVRKKLDKIRRARVAGNGF